MEKRKLGSTGFEVAPLALGGNVFGWTADEAMSFQLLDAFVAAGFNLIDTADSYSRWVSGHQGGESETILGRWIARRGRHDDVIIATKVGADMGQGHKVLRKGYILQAVEASLRRLQGSTASISTSRTGTTRTRRSRKRLAPTSNCCTRARSRRSAPRIIRPRA
jgi:aryl-alcohol dehydrogenase-like predicted oxidoreductase